MPNVNASWLTPDNGSCLGHGSRDLPCMAPVDEGRRGGLCPYQHVLASADDHLSNIFAVHHAKERID